MRKVKVTYGMHQERPGFFHGYFTYADEDGSSAGAVVEFEDGTCDWFSPTSIVFDNPPKSESGDSQNVNQQTK